MKTYQNPLTRRLTGSLSYKRYNKYRNQPTEYGGKHYASKREASFAAELDVLQKVKKIKSWDRQVRIPLRVNGRLITNYVCDFEIRHNDGSLEYVEVKGYEKTPEWKIKWALFDALWPDYRKRIVT